MNRDTIRTAVPALPWKQAERCQGCDACGKPAAKLYFRLEPRGWVCVECRKR